MSVDRRAASSRGFSLLEALVATGILAALFGAALQVFAGAVSRDEDAEGRLRILRRAQDLVRQTTAEFDGSFGFVAGQDAELRWSVETAPLHYGEVIGKADRNGPVPVRLKVIASSRYRAQTQLDTVFLFEDVR